MGMERQLGLFSKPFSDIYSNETQRIAQIDKHLLISPFGRAFVIVKWSQKQWSDSPALWLFYRLPVDTRDQHETGTVNADPYNQGNSKVALALALF